MSMSYKRSTRETETYIISKIGKQKKKLNSSDDVSISTKELIDEIENRLKHLKGQRVILQRAKEGKSYRHAVSSKPITNNQNKCTWRYKFNCDNSCNVLKEIGTCKTIKVADSCTQIGSSSKHLNTKRICRRTDRNENSFKKIVAPEYNCTQNSKNKSEPIKSTRIKKITNESMIKCQRSQKHDYQNLERTKSSIRRHAKLSEEILEYANQRRHHHRATKKPNEVNEHHTKIFDKKVRNENTNLTENSITCKSDNVSTIKSKIIDDSTYTCPNNSDENNYLITPYVLSTNEEIEYSNIFVKPTKEFLVKEIKNSKSGEVSRFPSFQNKKAKVYKIYNEGHLKKEYSQKVVSQKLNPKSKMFKSSTKCEPPNFETTWESHANREGPLSSKFDTSHKKRPQIISPDNRTDYRKDYGVQSHIQKRTQSFNKNSVHTNYISNSYPSKQSCTKDYSHCLSKTKLFPGTKQQKRNDSFNEFQTNSVNGASQRYESNSPPSKRRCSTQSFSNNDQTNKHEAFLIEPDKLNMTVESGNKNSVSTLSCQNEKRTIFHRLGSIASGNISMRNPEFTYKQKEKFGVTSINPYILKNHETSLLETPELKVKTLNEDSVNLQANKQNTNSENEISLKQKRNSVEIKNNDLVSKSLDFESVAISEKNIYTNGPHSENYLQNKCTITNISDLGAVSAQTQEYGIKSKQIYPHPRSYNHESITNKSDSNSSFRDYEISPSSKTSSNEKELMLTKLPKDYDSQEVSRKISQKLNSLTTSLKYQLENPEVDKEFLPTFLTKLSCDTFPTLEQLKTKEIQDIKHEISLPIEFEQPLKQETFNTSTLIEKEKPENVVELFRSTLNGLKLGAIPKLNGNNVQSNAKSENENKNKIPGLKEISDITVSKSTGLKGSELGFNKKLNSFTSSQCLLSNESELIKSCRKLLSLPKIQNPINQNLELVSNKYYDEVIEYNFRKSPSKFKKHSNSSGSSKSFQAHNNNKNSLEKQCKTSSRKLNSVNLEGSDISNRSEFSLISAQSLEIELENQTLSEKSIKTFNKMQQRTLDSNMSLKFERTKGENIPVSFKSMQSNGQSDNELNENLDRNSLLKNENLVFLSDTLDQNIPVEGVSRDVSNLIQHLENRVRDCDQHAKKQSLELEKLKENCENIKCEELKKTKELKESTCKEVSENKKISKTEDINEVDEVNSCHCIFCEEENSTSEYSEEIPPFTGCECMKEDYYKIMQIAYNS